MGGLVLRLKKRMCVSSRAQQIMHFKHVQNGAQSTCVNMLESMTERMGMSKVSLIIQLSHITQMGCINK